MEGRVEIQFIFLTYKIFSIITHFYEDSLGCYCKQLSDSRNDLLKDNVSVQQMNILIKILK